MPTLNFLLYLAAIGAAYLFRLSYLGWFGPYLVAVVAVLPPLLFVFSLPSMLSLRVSMASSERCVKGREARLLIRFHCRCGLPLSRIKVSLLIENLFTGDTEKKVFSLTSVYNAEAALPLPTALCGQLRCTLISWECKDLLGLFSIKRKGGGSADCLVMPPVREPARPVSIDAALSAVSVLKPKYGGGYSEDHDLREYRPGDTVNSIHWKLSSKTDKVIVREPLVNANNRVFVLLNQVGADDEGLALLCWLSLQLCERETPHVILSGTEYSVSNESETAEALRSILSQPMSPPARFDRLGARCVFSVAGGEVKVL